MKKIGFDLGSAAIKAVLLDGENRVLKQECVMHRNRIVPTLADILARMLDDGERYALGVSGAMARGFALPEGTGVEEEDALLSARDVFFPGAKGIIHMGARDTAYIATDGSLSKNSNCASGTGAFFEEQAGRLEVPLEKISSLQQQARSVPMLAGRCSVFSKTDTIHLMQEGVPTADILLGLSYAVVRNYRANVLKNRRPQTPVLLSGGVMKNSGVMQAVKELLCDEVVMPDEPSLPIALGCALRAQGGFGADEIRKIFSETVADTRESDGLKPLYLYADEGDGVRYGAQAEAQAGKDYFLGVDIGSASIDLVLLSEEKKIVYTSYVRNLGQPVKIVQEEIAKLKACLPQVRMKDMAVTGSGREYVAKAIGAGMSINEITAQTEGAVMHNPAVSTIFEIGGQDSKYMSVRNGSMYAFEMNKVCAAGTGTFLEEQVKKLGVGMEEFIALAMNSTHPVALANRCTVFIEASVAKAVAEGKKLEDICAGLCYAIASNYIERVVGRHEIGETVSVQGGIAFNKAVVCAFRALTGKKVVISPFFHVSGALGAASLCMNRQFLLFNEELNRKKNQTLLEKSEQSYLGDYTPPTRKKKGVIGIPRVVFLHKMFPLFRVLLSRIGYEVLLSPLTDKEIVNRSGEHATAETCFPIKLIYGHIAWLLEQKVDYILLPRLYTIKHEGSVARHDYACMYMQSSPLLMEQAFHFSERGVKLLMPEFSIEFGKKFMLKSLIKLGRTLGAPLWKVVPAAIAGFKEVVKHTARLESYGDEQLEGNEPVFVLVSRVYNIIDPMLNMQIERHLMRLGCRVIHLEHLHASYMNVDRPYNNLYWPFGQHQLTGLKIIRDTPNLFPIYITNHGCGPDTVIQHFFQNEYGDKPYLQLEVDEHSSPVGVITRVEAFLHSLSRLFVEKAAVRGSERTVPEEVFAETVTVLPDYGPYTDIVEKLLPAQGRVIRVEPLVRHRNFTYAVNKEYHSMLVMLEEVINALEKAPLETRGKVKYELLNVADEGSETFGQYGRLIQQELTRRGYVVKLREFILEDILTRADYLDIFREIFARDEKRMRPGAKTLVIGEPLCVYKPYIYGRNMGEAEAQCMSLGEALLFHLREKDRKGRYKKRLAEIGRLHEQLCGKYGDSDVFTPMDRLWAASEGKLDFLVGNFGRYRFSKILCLEPTRTRKAVLLNSAEENTATVLKSLLEEYRSCVKVPMVMADTDYAHNLL